MIVVAQDEEGLRLAAAEMFEDAFEAPQRQKNERIAEMSSDPEAVLRATESKRTLSPGYYMWLTFVIEAIEEPMEAGIVLSESQMGAEELLGLQILRAARAEFRRKHPPCRKCGTPLRYEHMQMCNDCEKSSGCGRQGELMGNTSSITIEVNDQGALQAFKGINAEAAKLGPTLQPVQHISEQTFNNIEGGALRAREAAALMGEEFGVKVPRALRGVLAESKLIGPALSTAFSGLALIGFVDIAEHAGEAIAGFVDKLAGWSEYAKRTMDAQTELNKVIVDSNDKIEKLNRAYRLIGLEGVAAFSEKQKIANEDLDEAKKRVSDLAGELVKLRAQQRETQTVPIVDIGTGLLSGETTEPTAAAVAASSKMQDTIIKLAEAQQRLKELGDELRNVDKDLGSAFSKLRAEGIREIGVAAQEALTKLQAMIAETNKAGATPEQQINAELRTRQESLAKILVLEGDDTRVREMVAKASVAVEKSARDQRIKLLTDEADQRLKTLEDEQQQEERDEHARLEKLRRMEDETINIERSSAVAAALPWDKANVAIAASYQERMDKIREMLNTGDLDEAHAARQQAAAWNEAFGQMRDNLASQMQGLFDDITTGNIGKTFKKMFEQMVFQMVATWILGMNGMRSASAGAMGGGGGGILGTLFGMGGGGGGFGGGSAPGGTPPFVGGGIMNLFGGGSSSGGLDNLPVFSGGAEAAGSFGLLGLGISAGQGAGIPGVRLPSGSSSGGVGGSAVGALGGILNKIFPHGVSIGGANISGGALATLGLSLGISGIIGRTQGGGVLSVLEGAAGGAMTGFAFGGPIGAAIGGAIGLITSIFAGLFGQHKGDKARIQVMEPLIAQIKVIKDSFDVFQIDYNSGVGQLEQLRASSIASLNQIGGRQVSGNTSGTNKLVDEAEAYLKTTEAERMRRSQINFGPAQFHSGGFVDPALAGVPSWWGGIRMHVGGEVPAILQAGEHVINRSTVNRVGRGALDRMNAGGSAGGDIHVHINAVDAKSFEGMMRSGGTDVLISELRRARNEGAF